MAADFNKAMEEEAHRSSPGSSVTTETEKEEEEEEEEEEENERDS
jgi:hypothetical protein